MHDRRFACPGCGVSEIPAGREAGRMPGDARPFCPLTQRGGRRNCCPSPSVGVITEADIADICGALLSPPAFYNGGQWVYATSNLPGFEGQILAIVDIADPANPKTAGTWWHPGQHKAAGETYTPEDQRKLTAGRPYPQHGLSLHGGAYTLGDRAYCLWMRAGMVILDDSLTAWLTRLKQKAESSGHDS